MASTVKFCMGSGTTNYLRNFGKEGWEYQGALYFDITNKKIYLNGEIYGGNEQQGITSTDLWNAISDAISSVTSNANNGNNTGYEFTFTNKIGGTVDIAIPLATDAISGVMSAGDKDKLDKIDPDNYVTKEEGKGLSTNDFTDDYKNKLDVVDENLIEIIQIDGVNVPILEGKIVNLGIAKLIDDAVKDQVSTAYKYRGTKKTAADLANIVDPEVGDVYNIEEASTEYGAAGVNVAWNGTSWDSLGGIFSTADITGELASLSSDLDNLTGRVSNLEGIDADSRLTSLETSMTTLTGDGPQSISGIAQTVVNQALTWDVIE